MSREWYLGPLLMGPNFSPLSRICQVLACTSGRRMVLRMWAYVVWWKWAPLSFSMRGYLERFSEAENLRGHK